MPKGIYLRTIWGMIECRWEYWLYIVNSQKPKYKLFLDKLIVLKGSDGSQTNHKIYKNRTQRQSLRTWRSGGFYT